MSAGKVTKSPVPNFTGFTHIGFTLTLPSCNRKVSLSYLNKSSQKSIYMSVYYTYFINHTLSARRIYYYGNRSIDIKTVKACNWGDCFGLFNFWEKSLKSSTTSELKMFNLSTKSFFMKIRSQEWSLIFSIGSIICFLILIW